MLLFGFVTGLHLDAAAFLGRGRAFALVAGASVVVPTAAGFAGGLWIAARQPGELGAGIAPIGFAVAIGICIGVTALPVLGAILREMDLLGGRIGSYALGIAAVNDAALWLLLGGADDGGDGDDSRRSRFARRHGRVARLSGGPCCGWWRRRCGGRRPVLLHGGRMEDRAVATVCAVALASAIITQLLGLHYIFGAFVAGAVTPQELRKPLLDRLQVATVGLLMPFFFMLTGLRTTIDFGSLDFLVVLVITTALAIVGKVGGTALTARSSARHGPPV